MVGFVILGLGIPRDSGRSNKEEVSTKMQGKIEIKVPVPVPVKHT